MKKYSLAGKGTRLTYLACFLLPALLITAVFAGLGAYPFGEKTLLVVDMNNEYIDYLAQLNESVRSGGSLLRSWNMGMGLNMLGLIAFYTASPLNLAVLLLPLEWITETVFAVTVVKFGLCGLFFSLYARKAFHTEPAPTILFSVAYAMISYNIAYSSNVMWLDGVAFLPLVILGVERILEENRWGLFCGSLVYVFFSSYYIGYMVGAFAFLYFTARYFAAASSLKIYVKKLGRILGSAALAGGLCAFLLLPAFLNLRDGQQEMWNLPISLKLHYPLVRLGAKLLPGVYDSLTDSALPHIYLSVLGLLFCLLYFLNRKIPLREKLVYGGLLGFLCLSLTCEFLDLGWHAFEDPTWFPARYSFVFPFLCLFLGLRCLKRREGITAGALLGSGAVAVLLFAEVFTNRYRFVDRASVVLGIALVVAYTLLLLAGKRWNRRWAVWALLPLLCLETGYNAHKIIQGIDAQFRYRTRQSYVGYRETYAPALELLPQGPGGTYRVEIAEQRNANGAMALGYNSISHYSTTTDQNLNGLLLGMAYNSGTINEVRFNKNTPLGNGLLGIRYVLSRNELGGTYAQAGQAGTIHIWENPMAFPLGYFADSNALSFDRTGCNPFALQNDWAAALWQDGELPAPYTQLTVRELILTNVRETSAREGLLEYTREIPTDPARVEWVLENPMEQEAYAYFPAPGQRFSKVEAFVDGESAGKLLAYRNNPIISLGQGQTITLTLELLDNNLRFTDAQFYALDGETGLHLAAKAWEYPMEFTRFADTKVDAVFTAPRDGLLLTSFPYDKGWTVRVDGKKTPYEAFQEVFMAVPVTEGQHEIAMVYRPPGFVPGLIISAASLVVLLFLTKGRRASDKGKRG